MRKLLAILAVLAALAAPRSASALFHFAVIDEVMTSYDGDANVQFVEIRMLAGLQTFTANSVLAAFDAAGAYQGDVLVVPGNIGNGGPDERWLMGTTAFETAAGIQVDFEFTPGLIGQSGMVCWGGGEDATVPEDPPDWDRSVLANYVDCVAYGAYTGPTHEHAGTPNPLSPDGHSLRRIGETDNNAADFACGDPADPTNNTPAAGSLAATTPCPACGDGNLDAGEDCDDGNTVDGDECPATCLVGETLIPKGAAKCLDKLHGNANGVAKASNGLVKSCVGAFQKGNGASALDCIAADASGKRAKAQAKTTATETKLCTGANAPDFGSLGAAAWNQGGREASEFALVDLFEDAVPKGDVDDALVTKAANPAGAKCQATAIAQLARAVDGYLKTAQRLRKGILSPKGGASAPGSGQALADALDAALASDPKLAKLETQVGGAVAKACPTFEGLFGPPCNTETTPAGLGACVYRTGACDACLGIVKGSGIPVDCTAVGGVGCVPPS